MILNNIICFNKKMNIQFYFAKNIDSPIFKKNLFTQNYKCFQYLKNHFTLIYNFLRL